MRAEVTRTVNLTRTRTHNPNPNPIPHPSPHPAGPSRAPRNRGGSRALPAAAPLGQVRAADGLARLGGVLLWRAPPALPRAVRRARPDGQVPQPAPQRDAIWERQDATIVASASACAYRSFALNYQAVLLNTVRVVRRGRDCVCDSRRRVPVRVSLSGTRYAHPLPDGAANPWEAGAEGDARSPGVVELAGSPTNGFVGYKLHNTPAAAQQRKAAPLCLGGIAAALMSAIHRCLRRFQGSR